MNTFNIVVEFDLQQSIDLTFPKIGLVQLKKGQKVQLLNAPVEVIEYLRTLRQIGVEHQLNKLDRSCKVTYDYKEFETGPLTSRQAVQEPSKSMKDRLGEYEIKTGKFAGKKISEVEKPSLMRIAKNAANTELGNVINSYLILEQ